MNLALRAGVCLLREGILLALALGLHLVAALAIAHIIIGPRPATPDKPILLVNSIEVSLAEVESIVPTRAEARPKTAPALAPTPSAAPYLFDAASPLTLPEPPPPELPAATNSSIIPPPLPADHALQRANLPEITFPPAEAPAAETSAGATARVEKRPTPDFDPTFILKYYPAQARARGWQGTVILDVFVAEDGTCREATIHTSSGHAILDKAALRMIRAARFRNGPGHIRQPIDFSLR